MLQPFFVGNVAVGKTILVANHVLVHVYVNFTSSVEVGGTLFVQCLGFPTHWERVGMTWDSLCLWFSQLFVFGFPFPKPNCNQRQVLYCILFCLWRHCSTPWSNQGLPRSSPNALRTNYYWLSGLLESGGFLAFLLKSAQHSKTWWLGSKFTFHFDQRF